MLGNILMWGLLVLGAGLSGVSWSFIVSSFIDGEGMYVPAIVWLVVAAASGVLTYLVVKGFGAGVC